MKKQSGPKNLKDKVLEATRGMKCPVHSKDAQISVDQGREEITITACCTFFKTDVKVITDRVLRAWKLHGEHLKARRDERG